MRFTYDNGRTVEWKKGLLFGDPLIIEAVTEAVRNKASVSFAYWAEQDASIQRAFDAYITIGSVITEQVGEYPEIDEIPDNPEGYEPEGPVYEDLTASASRFFQQ